MNCVVTAGPTYEPLDEVRRLTNFSTGRLGSELANFLTALGHYVTLLIGEQATYHGEQSSGKVKYFTSAANLGKQLQALSQSSVDAVFHAAAVSDFSFGKVYARSMSGEMSELKSGKISTHQGALFAELVPTSKIIGNLREWYPKSLLVGWKFEVDGDRASVVALAERQMAECRTDACVANGPAYGSGFGVVTGHTNCLHVPDTAALFVALERLIHK